MALTCTIPGGGGGIGMYYTRGQGPIKVLDAVRWVKRGGYGPRTGCAAPHPPLVSRRDGRTGRPGSSVCPLCPPMALSRAPQAPCRCQRGARPL